MLHNYLRTYRKRARLTQREVAFLIGCESRSEISHYERSTRTPSIEAALSLCVLFNISAEQLFPGICEDIEQKVKKSRSQCEALLNSGKVDLTTVLARCIVWDVSIKVQFPDTHSIITNRIHNRVCLLLEQLASVESNSVTAYKQQMLGGVLSSIGATHSHTP